MDASTSDPADVAIDRIFLDIKDLGAREGWGEGITKRLRERLLASHDGDIKHFLSSLERHRSLWPWGQVLIGMGELVLAAFLTIGGLVLFVPAILGFTSRGQVARYVADLALGLSSPGMSDSLIVTLGFGFALFLILAALYTLRQASRNLRASGLVPPTP